MATRDLTTKDLIAEYRLTHCGDNWGNCMEWWFAIADEIYWNRAPHLRVPDNWQFRPSPLGPQNEPESYTTEIVQSATDSALEEFGAMLHRYAAILKKRGEDY